MDSDQKWTAILKWCGLRTFTEADAKQVGGYSFMWIGKWALPVEEGFVGFKFFEDLPSPILDNIFKLVTPKLKVELGEERYAKLLSKWTETVSRIKTPEQSLIDVIYEIVKDK